MEEKMMYLNTMPGLAFMAIAVLAVGLGIYGFFVVIAALRIPNHQSQDEQFDRVMIGLFNIVVSFFAVSAIIFFAQMNAHELLAQSDNLLEHLK